MAQDKFYMAVEKQSYNPNRGFNSFINLDDFDTNDYRNFDKLNSLDNKIPLYPYDHGYNTFKNNNNNNKNNDSLNSCKKVNTGPTKNDIFESPITLVRPAPRVSAKEIEELQKQEKLREEKDQKEKKKAREEIALKMDKEMKDPNNMYLNWKTRNSTDYTLLFEGKNDKPLPLNTSVSDVSFSGSDSDSFLKESEKKALFITESPRNYASDNSYHAPSLHQLNQYNEHKKDETNNSRILFSSKSDIKSDLSTDTITFTPQNFNITISHNDYSNFTGQNQNQSQNQNLNQNLNLNISQQQQQQQKQQLQKSSNSENRLNVQKSNSKNKLYQHPSLDLSKLHSKSSPTTSPHYSKNLSPEEQITRFLNTPFQNSHSPQTKSQTSPIGIISPMKSNERLKTKSSFYGLSTSFSNSYQMDQESLNKLQKVWNELYQKFVEVIPNINLSYLPTQKNLIGRGQYCNVYLGLYSVNEEEKEMRGRVEDEDEDEWVDMEGVSNHHEENHEGNNGNNHENSSPLKQCAVKCFHKDYVSQMVAMTELNILTMLTNQPYIIQLIGIINETEENKVFFYRNSSEDTLISSKSNDYSKEDDTEPIRVMTILEYASNGNIFSWIKKNPEYVSKKLWIKWGKLNI